MRIDYPGFSFIPTHSCSSTHARVAQYVTPHGAIETPAFIFCGTKAAIKIATPRQVKDAGTQIILANTYHLMLQPGADLVEKAGGLHKFMGWDGPMLTDSGGFQIFSLGHGGAVVGELKGAAMNKKWGKSMLKIDEEGATFRSYHDGSLHRLTPESAMDIQRKLGADMVVALDECTPLHEGREYTANSMRMSMRWEKRSLEQFARHHDGKQVIYAISQGGIYPDLRRECADFMNDLPFFGHAIGGSWGDTKDLMYEIFAASMERLDKSRPTHVLGCGGLQDILEGVKYAGDTFDCVHPTRIARHGIALTEGVPGHRLNLFNSRFRNDQSVLGDYVKSEVGDFSLAYVHHLFKAKETLGMQILAIHNMAFMNQFMANIRTAIKEDRFTAFYKTWMETSEGRNHLLQSL